MDEEKELNAVKPAWWEEIKETNLPAILINKENRILAGNVASQCLLGSAESQLTEHTLVQLTHPGDRAKETNVFIDTFYGNSHSSCYPKHILREDGSNLACTQILIRMNDVQEKGYALALLGRSPLSQETTNDLQPFMQMLESQQIGFGANGHTSGLANTVHILNEMHALIGEPVYDY